MSRTTHSRRSALARSVRRQCAFRNRSGENSLFRRLSHEQLEDRRMLSFAYADFSDPSGLNLVGDATSVGSALRVTPAEVRNTGAAWYEIPQFVSVGFELTFAFQLTNPFDPSHNGGGGFAFVIQNSQPDALGGVGAGMGYAFLPNTLAVEFDTGQNENLSDPSHSHVSVQISEADFYGVDHEHSLGAFTTSGFKLDDGNVHTARIQYVPGTMTIYLDDLVNPALTVAVELDDVLELDVGRAWVGFSAATWDAPGGVQNHDVLNWQYTTLADTTMVIGIDNVEQVEGTSGSPTQYIFTVARLGDTSQDVSVSWISSDGTAEAGADYGQVSGQFTFTNDVTTYAIPVAVVADGLEEDAENFFLDLALVEGSATIADRQGSGTILNDDTVVTIDDVTAYEGVDSGVFAGAFVSGVDWNQQSGLTCGPDVNGDGRADLIVLSDWGNSAVAYDGISGTFINTFATGQSGVGMPQSLAYGPDGNLYISTGYYNGVQQYDGVTGTLIGDFVSAGSGGLVRPFGMAFGPGGDLYVTSEVTATSSAILQFNGSTGAFIKTFVAAGSGGLDDPHGLVFGPDGNIYVSEPATDSILRFDGADGAFLGDFVAPQSGGLANPHELAFGPDGNLYVSEWSTDSVLRFDGSTGVYIDKFAPSESSGLDQPRGLAFDADGTLYVASGARWEILRFAPKSSAVYTISLTAPSALPVTVDFNTLEGTAEAGVDYEDTYEGETRRQTLVFLPGEVSKTIIVPTIYDSDSGEDDETFTVILSNPTGGATIPTGQEQGTATITEPKYTVYENNVPLTLKDAKNAVQPGVTTSTMFVADTGNITDLNVKLDIRHTYDGQLTATLYAPNGTSVELFSNVGGSGDNFTATTLDGDTATSITSGSPPFTGIFRPKGNLALFNDIDKAGTWTLEIIDNAKGDTGTLNSWLLDIAMVVPTPEPGITVEPTTGLVTAEDGSSDYVCRRARCAAH